MHPVGSICGLLFRKEKDEKGERGGGEGETKIRVLHLLGRLERCQSEPHELLLLRNPRASSMMAPGLVDSEANFNLATSIHSDSIDST